MSEVQKHGFIFEDKVLNILGIEKNTYTNKWDACINNKNISIKCIGRNNAVELGSLQRFWGAEPFTMIIGWWEQVDGFHKKITGVDELDFTEEILKKLKGNLTNLDIISAVNTLTLASFPVGEHEKARSWFKNWKKEYKDKMGLLTLTGKVDSSSQRRWQCSINKTNYKKLFSERSNIYTYNGVGFSDIESSVRR